MYELIVIAVLIALNGLLSMSEIAVVSARKSKLQSEAENGDKKAEAALRLAGDQDRFLSSVQIGITLIGILTGIFSGNKIASIFAEWMIALGMGENLAFFIAKGVIVIIVTYFTILFGELVPKRAGLSNPEKVAKRVAGTMENLSRIASPLVWLLSRSTSGMSRMLGIKEADDKVTEDEIMSLIQEGSDEGEVSQVEQDIVERVFALGDLSVSTIMTLRDDIVWLDFGMTEQEIIDTIENNIYEMYPVANGDLDNIEGVFLIKDYVLNIRQKGGIDLKKMMKKPVYVHENMSVYAVLEYMKQQKVNRALVCDEFGSLCGVIALKDILDALVGSTSENHLAEPDIVPRKNGEGYIVDGQCSIFDFLKYFDMSDDMEDFDFSTVGGLVLEVLEHVPSAGECMVWKCFEFEVADMDGARIDKLLVKIVKQDAEAGKEAEEE